MRLHPHELEPLLERISIYLRSSSWETRIAASQAIEAVIKQIPPWCPSGLPPVKIGVFAFKMSYLVCLVLIQIFYNFKNFVMTYKWMKKKMMENCHLIHLI